MLGNLNSPNAKASPPLTKFSSTLSPSDYRAWTTQNLYRTSTSDMSSPDPIKSKNYAIPGYTGLIPGVKSDNNFGKTFSKISREQLTREKYLPSRVTEFFPKKPVIQSAMGRTLGKFGGGLEDEYHTVSRFHGKSTFTKEHPNYIADGWMTITKSSFTPQEPERKNIFRTTDLSEWKKSQANHNDATKASGFVKNFLVCDGEGWIPIKELHGDMTKTEYRKKFTNEVPFHPKPLKSNRRKLKKEKITVE